MAEPTPSIPDKKSRRTLAIVLALLLIALAVGVTIWWQSRPDSDADETSTGEASPAPSPAETAEPTPEPEPEVVFIATTIDGIPETATTGAIHYSADAVTWEEVLTTFPLYGVATAPELAIAVGATPEGGGVVHTSVDGRTWSEPIQIIDPLIDVAYGNGVWLAVGNRSFAEESGAGDGSSGAFYASTDGRSWQRVATTNPYENPVLGNTGDVLFQAMRSVGYGAGTWVATASQCAFRTCELVQFTSTDTVNWARHSLDSELLSMDFAHDGERWALLGTERDPAGVDVSMADINRPLGVAGTTTDPENWSLDGTAPDRIVLQGLALGPDSWLAVDVPTYGSTGSAPSAGGVYRSASLLEWERIGVVREGITAIAALTPGTAIALPPAPPPTEEATPPQEEPITAIEIRILTRGLMLFDDASTETRVLLYEDDAGTAVSALTAALGEPETSQRAGDGYCSTDSTVVEWDGLSIVYEGTDPATSWFTRLTGTASDIPQVPTGVAGGFTLGSTSDEVRNYFPGAPHETYTYEGSTYDLFYLDVADNGELGTQVMAVDGTVTTISAPVYVEGDC